MEVGAFWKGGGKGKEGKGDGYGKGKRQRNGRTMAKEHDRDITGKEEAPSKQRYASVAVAWATARRSVRCLRPLFRPYTSETRIAMARVGMTLRRWQGGD